MSSRQTSTESSSYGTNISSTTTSTEQPQLPVPLPTPRKPKKPTNRDRISSEAAENTALIIGIIAGAMIAIVLIILIILKFKNRSDGSYKVDESKNYHQSQGPAAALLGSGNGQQRPQQMNGNIKNGSDKCASNPSKKRDIKDVKEWYV
jgi:hypothetical protein